MKILFFALFIFSTSLVNAKTLWKENNGTTIFHANKIYKSGKNIMYTFTIMVHIANVYIIFLPDFIFLWNKWDVQFVLIISKFHRNNVEDIA